MKKKLFLSLCVLFAMLQTNAQVTVDASKSGYVQNTGSTNTIFYETAIKIKGTTAGWSRIGYVEVPITEATAVNKAEFNVYLYKSDKDGDFPVTFSSMSGPLPADLGFINQPAEDKFTALGSTTVNKTSYGWVTVDITDVYNAALQAADTSLSIRMISDQTTALLEFYSLATGTSDKPYLSIQSNCPPEYNDVEKTLVVGQSIQVGDETVTETGTYQDISTTACGAEKIDTYYVLFIADGTVTNNVAICEGGSHEVQVGPNAYKTYSEAGEYTDIITSDDASATQTIITNISINPLPTPQELGDDTEIREGETFTLNAGSDFTAYQWFNNGVAIEGETNSTLMVTSTKDAFTFGTNEISVAVTDANGCIGMSSKDIWVDIVGNFIAPSKDMYLEEAGDRLLDIARLEVKYDTWGDANSDVAGAPFYTKEIHLAFDLSSANLPENSSNFKLKLFMYALNDNAKQPVENPSVNINCDYADGLYADDMIWTTRTSASDRTPLAQPLTVTTEMVNSAVEWDINDVFVSDILGKKNQFTIILSIPNDSYSILAKFREMNNANVDLRPALTFDLNTAIEGVKEQVQVTLMPNPVKTDLYIQSDENFTSARVYDMLGQLVISTKIEYNRINVSNLSKGQYIVSLINEKQEVSKMILKK